MSDEKLLKKLERYLSETSDVKYDIRAKGLLQLVRDHDREDGEVWWLGVLDTEPGRKIGKMSASDLFRDKQEAEATLLIGNSPLKLIPIRIPRPMTEREKFIKQAKSAAENWRLAGAPGSAELLETAIKLLEEGE